MQGKELLDRLEELKQRCDDHVRMVELQEQDSLDEEEDEELQLIDGTEPLDQEEAQELEDLEREEPYIRRDSELIEEEDFEDHVRNLAEDCYGVDTSKWPYTCIDWEKAAEELAHDYTTIEVAGTTYYVRD